MFKRITEIPFHAIILLHTKNLYATFRRNTMWTTIKGKEGLVPLYAEPQQRKPLTEHQIELLAVKQEG